MSTVLHVEHRCGEAVPESKGNEGLRSSIIDVCVYILLVLYGRVCKFCGRRGVCVGDRMW